MISIRRGVTRSASWLVLVLAVLSSLFFFVILTRSAAAADPKADANAALDRDFEVQVVDSVSKEPIPGAAVTISMSGAQTRKDQTEDKGRVWVLLPEKDPSYLNISVKMDGYVASRIEYREGTAIPATYTIELARGISIGGTVQDEQGNPIAGVDLTSMFPGGDPAMRKRMNFYETVTAKSDDQGRWRCDGIPADLKDISIRVIHPEFLSDKPYDYTTAPPMDQLRAMKGVIVLKRGLMVSGVVLDEAGKPIENATVTNGNERYGTRGAKVRTDAGGRFVLKNMRAEAQTLSVTAKQHAPAAREIKISKDMPPLEFRLGKGNTIRGKVVDVNGKPIGGVSVGISTYRGENKWQWNANTKGDGSFLWAEAPAEEVTFEVMKQGYMIVREFKMSPSEKEYVITLAPPLKIRGSVVDADTGKAIESFTIVPGRRDYPNTPVMWQRYDSSMKKGQDGKYEVEMTEPGLAWLVSIEAPGYVPAVSPEYKSDLGDAVFDVKLKKGTGPAGIVRKPDGTPAAGVDVVLATPSSQVMIQDGALGRNTFALSAKTAADGKFEFSPQVDAFVVLAIADEGYVEMTPEQLKASSDVKLQPWGKVVGKLKRGSKPWPGETVMMNYDTQYDGKAPRIYISYQTKSDQDGNFTFERAVPKDTRVSRQLYLQKSARGSSYTYSHPEKITVKPGETVNVQIGGKGRAIIGKVAVPNDPVSQAWNLQGTLDTHFERPNLPDGYDEWSDEKRKEWGKARQEAMRQTPEARRYYSFPVEEDRSFRIEDVAPGAYRLAINVYQDSPGRRISLAGAQMEVKIDEIPGGQTDEPLDVGTIDMKPTQLLKVGGELPVTVLKTIDGPPVNLTEYKGKFVLIHLWASMNKKFSEELPVLKEIQNEFGKDGRLVIVGINTNSIPATAKAFAEKNGMTWVQAYMGMNSMIYQEMKFEHIPAWLLVGPDGKLISDTAKIEDLKAAVSQALKK
jgi:protocatechuate 3,4-dioxygenase beta subunit